MTRHPFIGAGLLLLCVGAFVLWHEKAPQGVADNEKNAEVQDGAQESMADTTATADDATRSSGNGAAGVHYISKSPATGAELENTPRAPQAVVSTYLAYEGADQQQYFYRLWPELMACSECLDMLRDMIVQQALDQQHILQLTHMLMEVGNQRMFAVLDGVLQPGTDAGLAMLLTQQVMRNGREEFVAKVVDVMQQADLNGAREFALQLIPALSAINSPDALKPVINAAVRGPASNELLSALVTAIGDKINYLPDTGELADYLLELYEGAEGRQRDRLWRIMSGHGQSLVSFAMDAQAQGDTSRVDQAAAALAQLNHAAAVDGIMALRQQLDYPQDYFMGYVRALTQAHNNPVILQRLGDYLQDPAADLQSRLIAAEGLLAVKQSPQAKYILDKLVNSNEYTDAELAAYINGRL